MCGVDSGSVLMSIEHQTATPVHLLPASEEAP
nr:MAG TPA: hypothetical protein [Caudoviricetes sp.]